MGIIRRLTEAQCLAARIRPQVGAYRTEPRHLGRTRGRVATRRTAAAGLELALAGTAIVGLGVAPFFSNRRLPRAAAAGTLLAVAASLFVATPAHADNNLPGPENSMLSATSGSHATYGGPTTQYLEIRLETNGSLLTVSGDSTSAGAGVNVHRRVADKSGWAKRSQLWQFIPDNGVNDVFQGTPGQLRNLNSGLCLNVPGATATELVQLIQWPCEGAANEKWYTVKTGPKTFGFAAMHAAGVYLGINQMSCIPADNSAARIRSTYNNDCGRWNILRYGGQPARFSSVWHYLDSMNPTNAAMVTARIQEFDDSRSTQQWHLQLTGWVRVELSGMSRGQGWTYAPAYKIVSVRGNDWANAVCLDAFGAQPQVYHEVGTYPCDPNAINQPNQLWILGGYYTDKSGTERAFSDKLYDPYAIYLKSPFAIFNVAMLDPSRTTKSYPVLSVNSSYRGDAGDSVTMAWQGGQGDAGCTQVWYFR